MPNNNVGHNERLYRKNRLVYKAHCEQADTPCMHCKEPILWDPPRKWHPLSFTVEHLVPRSMGGLRDDPSNWGCAHYKCNSRRGNRPLPLPGADQYTENHSEEWP